MSAIAGAVFTDQRDMAASLIDRLARAASPRGFDGMSQWHAGPAGFVRFHHATTPEAVGETQPLTGRSGAVIVFDGRLDNRADLLALLGAQGAGLAGAPDVAIALALFEARGERFLRDLVGDWALAIWQPGPHRLFLARSPMGWRPLLWCHERGTFGFATEPRALVVGLGLDRRLNEGAIGEMVSGRFISNTDTFWAGVSRVEQGGALALENGRVRTWHWHDGPFEDFSRRSDAAHVERFRQLLDTSLIAAMRSNTPVGAHLSGGLDSSTVVARLTELHRAGVVDRQVNPLSARFPGEAQDETRWSSAVEEHLGISARVIAREPYDLDAAAAWCASSLQLPLRPNMTDGTTGGIHLQHKLGERVLLTGEGGDDWLGGGLGHLPDLLRRGDLLGLWREAMELFPAEPLHVRLRRTGFLALAPIASPARRKKFLTPHLVFDADLPDWIRPEWAARNNLVERWRDTLPPLDPTSYAQKQRYAVFVQARRHIGMDNVMAYAERHGVEMRHPLHDLRLTGFIMGASGRMLRRRGERKYILREAMRGTLPESVRQRQDKAVFVTSIIDALIERFRRRPPHDMTIARLGWIDANRLAEMFAPARAWREQGMTGTPPRTRLGPIWFVVAMDMWLENAAGL